MKEKTKKIVLLAVIIVLIILSAVFWYFNKKNINVLPAPSNQRTQTDENTSEKAPDITVTDINGNKVKLSDFTGKTVVLNFFSSHCPPCRQEIPDFQKAYQKYSKDDGIEFLFVSIIGALGEKKDDAKNYFNKNNFNLPLYLDEDASASDAFGVSSVPHTFIIDKDGTIKRSNLGMMDYETLQSEIEKLLNK